MPKENFYIKSISTPKIIRSKRRTLALQIDPEGNLIVRAPLKLSQKYIDRFIIQQEKWIQKHQTKKQGSKSQPKKIIEGEMFWLFGYEYPLALNDQISKIIFHKNTIQYNPQNNNPEKIFREFYKKELRKILPNRVISWAKKMDLKPREIKVSSANRRWGSCNRKGILNFSYRLAMVPDVVLDYVIVHELSHLKKMDHSPAFWKMVEKFIPEHKKQKKWLRENEAKLALRF